MTSRPHLQRLLAAVLVAASTACASGGAKSTSAAPRPARQTARSNVLTAEEIANAHIANAYDLVASLRPRWLQTRGVDSFQKPSEIQIYLGNTHMQGGVTALREIQSLGITKIEFVDGITASARWGLDHGAGAIVVSLSSPP